MFAGALIAADDALDVLLIGLHVQIRVSAAACALRTVGLRVWCHAVGRLLLELLLRHSDVGGGRGRDQGAKGRELLV